MAITRIRGGQIHDRTINGDKIKQNVLTNEHIAENAAIHESKLDINWASHGQDILETKKVVDFVQVNKTEVSGLNSINLNDLNIFNGNNPAHVLSDPLSGEGIIIDSPKNKVVLRNSVTGEPVLNEDNLEIFGRMFFDEDAQSFIVNFYVDNNGSEVSVTMPNNTTIDWQYAQRFNLQTVNEMFAANEKFVEGAADATAHLNIEQLAKDVYGSNFSLDRDGNGNLAKSLLEQLQDEISTRQSEDARIESAIEQEALDRANADTVIRNDFASTMVGKGASMIGVEDADGHFDSENLEGVLKELAEQIDAVSGLEPTEIVNARKSTSLTGTEVVYDTLDERLEASEAVVKSLNDILTEALSDGSVTPVVYNSLKERLDAIDSAIAQEKFNRESQLEQLTEELENARGSKSSLDERLDVSLNEDGTLKVSNKIHQHKKYVFQATQNTNVIDMPAGETYKVGDGSVSVYVNGLLQANGINFNEVPGGASIDFGADQILAGDIVVIEYIVYEQ
jgi:hypothetical protein